jgi:DNA-binding GntR family transcriptional regulator
MAGNRWRTQIVTDLRKVMKLNRHHSLFKQGRLADSLAEHRALMQALEARDAHRATQLMQAHFDNGLEAAA